MTNTRSEGSQSPKKLSIGLDLEKALQKRQVPLPIKPSWERETGIGIQHSFGEYRLEIARSDGTKCEVLIHEDCSIIATRVWDCSVATAKWIETQAVRHQPQPDLISALNLKVKPSPSRPVQVLELGAGTGLLSICLAKMGAAVMSTEYGIAVKYLTENCISSKVALLPEEANGCTLKAGMATCRELDWYKAEETLQSLFQPGEDAVFDLIIVTDCTLTTKDADGILDMIHKYGTKGHTQVVIGACREREGTARLRERAGQEFNDIQQIPESALHPDYKTSRHIFLKFQI